MDFQYPSVLEESSGLNIRSQLVIGVGVGKLSSFSLSILSRIYSRKTTSDICFVTIVACLARYPSPFKPCSRKISRDASSARGHPRDSIVPQCVGKRTRALSPPKLTLTMDQYT